ncbi:hypothetical protein C8F04DRAFT_1340353 [Mycena alexandri]|uniref:F-box domain-containing protein n=1 Tax=Mycena alexandri TaxID=1745969 RepID=A0AAD6SXP9_9AGAR|nr:hypothetical protein C8F04DRAFT_1340353 [Mycena alexandri]
MIRAFGTVVGFYGATETRKSFAIGHHLISERIRMRSKSEKKQLQATAVHGHDDFLPKLRSPCTPFTSGLQIDIWTPKHIASPSQNSEVLVELQAHIHRHKKYIEALGKQQLQLADDLSRLAYPFLTLPTEIVSRIFVACLPGHRRTRPSSRTVPLTLAQICSRWRSIALATSELWTSPDLQLTYRSTAKGLLPLLDAWILRAKGHPLSLTLRSKQSLPSPILSVIPSLSGRLQYLELDLLATDLPHFHVPLPSLHHLALAGTFPPEVLTGMLRNIACLRELRVPDLDNASQFNLALPSSLTTLEIGLVPPTTILHILTNYPSLSELKCTVRGQLTEIATPMTFPTLRSLAISNHSGVLYHLRLPNLTQLSVNGEDVHAVESLVKRSGCLLPHLSVVRLEMDVGPQINVLLTHLLSRPDSYFSTVDGILPHRVPKLVDLRITTSSIDVDYELVVALLAVRQGCERLRSFHIIIETGHETDVRHKRFFKGCPGPLASARIAVAPCNFGLKFVIRNPHSQDCFLWDNRTGSTIHDTDFWQSFPEDDPAEY